jgi:hypothetical protein
MRVIFLDIDGVLNHRGWMAYAQKKALARQEALALSPILAPTLKNYKESIDPGALTLLHVLLEQTQAHIVVSSTWRKWHTVAELEGLLEWPVLDVTPIAERIGVTYRGECIAHWLSQHPEVTDYLIIDDDTDPYTPEHRMILTRIEGGGFTGDLLKLALDRFGVA